MLHMLRSWTWLCVLGLATALVLINRGPPDTLQRLDPALLKSVTTTASAHDIADVSSALGAKAEVRAQLYSTCTDWPRCAIHSALIFPGAGTAQARTTHLVVAIDVNATSFGPLSDIVWQSGESYWEVRVVEAQGASNYVVESGSFRELSKVPQIGERDSAASLLRAMEAGIKKTLIANLE